MNRCISYNIQSMFNKLALLKHMGYTPDTIMDIGAYHGDWTNSARQIFGDECQYYLFEAINYQELNQFHDVSNITVFNVILNDKMDEIDWFQMKNTGDSMFREKTHYFDNCDIIRRNTIDLNTLIQEKDRQFLKLKNASNILIKVDCQGAEIPILKGASNILGKADFIILEIPLFGQYNEGVPTFLEHIQFMNDIGFIPYDVLEPHYINGFNMQIDMMFINKTHRFNEIIKTVLKG